MQHLAKVGADEVTADWPLPFAVFDGSGTILFTRGVVIASIGYVRLLLARGLYRLTDEEPDQVTPRTNLPGRRRAQPPYLPDDGDLEYGAGRPER